MLPTVQLYVPLHIAPQGQIKCLKSKCLAPGENAVRWREVCVTCRDDSDAESAWREAFLGAVLVHAVVLLRPRDQPVNQLAKHPISTHAHHPVGEVKGRVGKKALPATVFYLIGPRGLFLPQIMELYVTSQIRA